MRYFYIDTENRPATSWISGLQQLKSTDKVFIVYTKNSSRIPVELFPVARECKADIITIEAQTGTCNALDFVLVTLMGQKALTAAKSAHIVISADKGYDASVTYLSKTGVCAIRAASLQIALKTLQETKY